MKKTLFALVILISISLPFKASAFTPPDEGMWLPMFVERLNYVDMQKMGLHLTAEELYSVNHSSLKDAVVNFGNFCTAEVVSAEGLLFTNHHCGYEAIQQHSSVNHDYLTNGFWAMNKSEELPNEGLTASFLVRMEDVSSKVFAEVKEGMTETDRSDKIKSAISKLKKEASEKGKYEVSVKSFFEGNEYYMFVYVVYEDVRLVGAPPSSVGKFGGDTDNWMWPRHTGDFSIFRVYTGPDGAPAKYSKDNVPLQPKHHLPVSIKGLNKGDFTMIWGYPGRTDRFLTSYGITDLLNETAPSVIKLREKKLAIMKEGMDASDSIRIKYSSKYAQIANYWKYFIGQSKGLKRLQVYERKKELENKFSLWVNADETRKLKYGNVLKDFEEGYKLLGDKKINKRMWYFQETFTGAEILYLVYKVQGIESILKNKDFKQEDFSKIRETAKEHFKDYYAPLDKKEFAALLEMYYNDIPKEYHPKILTDLHDKYKGDFNKLTNDVYAKSIFSTAENFEKFLKKPSMKVYTKDIAKQISSGILATYINLGSDRAEVSKKTDLAKRLFVDGLRKMDPTHSYYPDANSTMRMTYGQVLDYYPADAVFYDYKTTLSGIMEKEDPKNEEFIVPAKLKEVWNKKDFGRYGKDGNLNVCFIHNTDITGGNSGSPVINGNGQLVGIAFDGNWEAMSGDVAYEKTLQRTISVDIRYVLFMIDKYAGASNLIKELTIVE